MSWNVEAQQVVKDCEHTGNCPCHPEECEVCKGTGMVLFVEERPMAWVEGRPDGEDFAAALSVNTIEFYHIKGYLVGSEEGEEMTCPECHGEGSLS